MATLDQLLTDAITAQNALTQQVANSFPAVRDGIAAHQVATNPHTQYMQKTDWGIDGYTQLDVGIGKPFASIQAAFDSLQGKSLKADVLIKVADGNYTTSGYLFRDHPQGSRIRIDGNIANPAACLITLVPDANKMSHGVSFSNVTNISFSGFKILGQATASNWTHRCLRVDGGSIVNSIDNSIIIDGGCHGVEVDSLSFYSCTGLIINNCVDWAAVVTNGSAMSCYSVRIVGLGRSMSINVPVSINKDTPSLSSQGILAQDGSRCWAYKAYVSACAHGYYAARSAYLYCDGAIAENGIHGFVSSGNSTIWCYAHPVSPSNPVENHGQAINCSGHGFYADWNAVIIAPGAVATGCSEGFMANTQGSILANDGAAVNCNTGYLADVMSFIEAYNTSTRSTGNATKYNPSASAVVATNGALIRFN